jgi:DNA-directed DNA polymerase III PolC
MQPQETRRVRARGLQRSIVHLDADAFFASVEQASDPRLRDKPIAVGGEKRGIIASASYQARKFGIYTPMPTALARRLCPKLIILPGDFEKYELFSRLMFSYAYDFTPDVEIGSIDEGYFDLTGTRKPALGVAEKIRDAIRQSLKLCVSEGIASNKLVSQIASKLQKPASFQFVPAGNEAGFLSPLENKWLPGVGPKTARQLNSAGLGHIGQIAHTPVDLLGLIVGRMAPQLLTFAAGVDERPIIPVRTPAKSYGEQETFAADTTDETFLEATLRRMADKLMARVREDHKSIRTVTVKVRYNDMDEEQAAESLAEPTDLETDIYGKTSQLLRKAWNRRVSLRLVSLKLSNVYDGRFANCLALDRSSTRHLAEQRLADVVDQLRDKFGRRVLLRGHDFIIRAKAGHGEEPAVTAAADKTSGVLREAPGAYKTAVVQRQRLGNSIALRGPEEVRSPKSEVRSQAGARTSCPLTVLAHPKITANPNSELRSAKSQAGARTSCPLTVLAHRPTFAPPTSYVPLNVHSCYSFLDSTLSITSIIDFAKRQNLPAIALTDHNNLHGAVEFAQAAAEAGIKPIIGAEIDFHGRRACLYVQNQSGYANLCRILSAIRKERPIPEFAPEPRPSNPQPLHTVNSAAIPTLDFGHRPSFGFRPPELGFPPGLSTFPELFANTTGLIAVSASADLARLFPDRFYLEINSLDSWEKPRPALPCVAAFPARYELPADRWKYDIVQSIRTLTLLRQEHPEKRLDGDFHLRPAADMRRFCADHPQLLAHSREIADRCSFTFALGKPQFPNYSPPDGSAPAAFLHRLARDGLCRRYPQKHASLKAQLEEELAIIMDVGYEEYFLVMWDILQECGRRGIEWITRGSAADSLVCYCLGISGVCPIRFDLYFRRFLNKDRMALNKLPDIDVDFPHDRKDDVIDLIFEKFGTLNTAVVGGFSTFQARSAFAEVAKVLGVSEYQVRRITQRFPHFSHTGELAEAIAGTQECRDLPLQDEPYATTLKMAQFLDGFPRYPKMHPCGLVLSRQSMHELTPTFTSAKGYPTTHFDMDSVEAIGLIKMDILAQGGLAVMRDVRGMIASPIGPTALSGRDRVGNAQSGQDVRAPTSDFGFPTSDFGLPTEPWDDPEVWNLIASGNARAVHHIESPAMISLCKMCNARDIDTLIAIVSVIRPGAANESKKMEFARRYQGLSSVHYPHPSLEACLRSTYGLVVYEEHILQICESFAGLPPGRADVLRRALGKDKTAVIEEIHQEFIRCACEHGRTGAEISEVWELVVGFRGYAFCKAHSTAYGVEAYQSAWLKRYYPAEFMAAVLTHGKGFYSPLVYILECHRLSIPLLPPCVNEPGPQFTVANGKIRVPVLQLKGLSHRTSEAILREHARDPFSSLSDFFLRVQPLPEDMELLIRAGAFDVFGRPRTAQYWDFKSLCSSRTGSGAKAATAAPPQQLWLLPPGDLERLPAVPLVEPGRLHRLRAEEELLGYCVSGHPLELFPNIAWETYCPINRLGNHLGEQVVTCGLVIEQRLFHQVTGEPMKFLTIADRTGIIETELFARTYQSYGLNTVRYRVLEITATVEPFENNRGHTLRVLRADKPRARKGPQATET